MLTGLQPSGKLHIGNYFGAIKPFLDFVDEHAAEEFICFLMIADYHALTSVRDADVLAENIRELARTYLAVGIDPSKVILFRQSDNPDHLELAWIFNCLVNVSFLSQAHAYKDKVAKGLEANAGLFTYPMLMASDIVLYDTDIVPVGEDQRQHVEYAREAVGKFNRAYGETLKMPKEIIVESLGVVPGLDGAKMSKSYNNTIPLFATREEIHKRVMKIVTDTDGERPENVYQIHKLFTSKEKLEKLYQEHAGQYKDLKEALVEDIDAFMQPLREKYEQITDAEIDEVLEKGKETVREYSQPTLNKVREKIGLRI